MFWQFPFFSTAQTYSRTSRWRTAEQKWQLSPLQHLTDKSEHVVRSECKKLKIIMTDCQSTFRCWSVLALRLGLVLVLAVGFIHFLLHCGQLRLTFIQPVVWSLLWRWRRERSEKMTYDNSLASNDTCGDLCTWKLEVDYFKLMYRGLKKKSWI